MTSVSSDTLKGKMLLRQVMLGPWLTVANQAVIEVLAQSGSDFLLVDGEHGLIETADLAMTILAAERHSCELVYRVRRNEEHLIKPAVDAGINAIMVPMVHTSEDAAKAVAAIKYAPTGKRGIGPLRASNYYLDGGKYTRSANGRTTVIAQIESVEGLGNVEAIAGVEGIDCLYCGPSDLQSSLETSGCSNDLAAAIALIAEAATRAGKAAGIDVWDPSQYAGYLEKGYTFFTQGMDLAFISDGAKRQLSDFKQILKQ